MVVEIDGRISIDDVSPDGDTLLLGSTRNGQMNCYRHDLASGETTEITDYERAVGAPMVSPDGDRIACETNETEDFENRDVYAAAVDGPIPGTWRSAMSARRRRRSTGAPRVTGCSSPTTPRTAHAVACTISRASRYGGSGTALTRKRPRHSPRTEPACSGPERAMPGRSRSSTISSRGKRGSSIFRGVSRASVWPARAYWETIGCC